MLDCDTEDIRRMQNELLDLIQPITSGEYNPKYLDCKKYNLSEKEKEYLSKYGYHRIKEFFEPHFSLGVYNDRGTRDEEMKYAVVPKGEFIFDVFQLDETSDSDYSSEKILWEAKLK